MNLSPISKTKLTSDQRGAETVGRLAVTEEHVTLMVIECLPSLARVSDERLDFLAERFELLKVRPVLGITFEMYVADPDHYERILAHMEAGGGCRLIKGDLIVIDGAKAESGTCLDCGQWWTARAGGIDENGQCPECARKYRVSPWTPVREGGAS